MSSQMISIVLATAKKVQTSKDPDQFTDMPVQLTLPIGLSYVNAKEACLEFVGMIEEMAKNKRYHD